MNKSIRFKLLALVIAILVPLTILRAVNIYSTYQEELKDNLNSYKNLASAISTSLNNYLEEVWIIEDIAGTYLSSHPELSGEETTEYLKLIQQKQKGFLRISWLNNNGDVISSSDERLIGETLSNRSYVEKIGSGETKVVSNLILSLVSPHQYIIPVARAIYSDEKLSGIIVAVIDINKLEEKLPEFTIDNTKRYQLIDDKGILVYCSDMDKIPDNKISYTANPGVRQALNGEVATTLNEISLVDASRVMSLDYPISEIGWVCKVSISYDAAVKLQNKELIANIIILTILVLLALIIAYFIGRILLQPLSVLRTAAGKIMDGDYSARTNLKRRDEIGLAAEAFDKMAESIEQWYSTKSVFFTNMSHELKTPLNVIFSSVQLIDNYKATLDPEHYQIKVSKQMKVIRQNCYRIMRLINNFIDISRHDSGFLKIKPVNYDIVKLIHDITLSVKRYVEAKEISLYFRSEVESRVMACDPDMIERIILNLISNAIKFTEKNGTITVQLKETEGCLQLSVSDTGIGIPQDKLNQIFERFKQVDDSLSLNKDGSGIGLSLVKAFVEAHGGTINVNSEVQKGTTFEINLPIRFFGLEPSVSDPFLLEREKSRKASAGAISRINIEFSDIYSCFDEEIS